MHNKVFLGTRKKSGSQVRQSQFAVQMADHCLNNGNEIINSTSAHNQITQSLNEESLY